MKRVFYEHKAPTTFEENFTFNAELPYSVRIKKFKQEDIVPLHYGKTIELLVCDGLSGFVTINCHDYTLTGKDIFVIPPQIVHSTTIGVCEGTMYILKISLENLAQFINLNAIFSYENLMISELAFTCPEYDNIFLCLQNLIKQDNDFFFCMGEIINIFNILRHYKNDSNFQTNEYSLRNTNLYELIKWTEKNYNRRISIEEVADSVGYSKYYFCNKFKAITGSTYIEYLNSVRLANASRLLQQNLRICEVCFLCGFDNVSYFSQLFKKVYGLSPSDYTKRNLKGKNKQSNDKND